MARRVGSFRPFAVRRLTVLFRHGAIIRKVEDAGQVEASAGAGMIAAFQRLEPRRRRAVTLILLLGLGSALFVFLTAVPAPDDYRIEQTKAYEREMETYGGKSNLLATDLREWLASLWHGERLAATITVLTFVALVLYLLGSRAPYAPAPRRGLRAVPREAEGADDEDSSGRAG